MGFKTKAVTTTGATLPWLDETLGEDAEASNTTGGLDDEGTVELAKVSLGDSVLEASETDAFAVEANLGADADATLDTETAGITETEFETSDDVSEGGSTFVAKAIVADTFEVGASAGSTTAKVETITVTNQSQLLSALANATGGETIVLADGNYGALNLSGMNFASNVTITSQNALGAKFTSAKITDASNITIDGVHVSSNSNGSAYGGLVVVDGNSNNIAFQNGEINGLVDGVYSGYYGFQTNGNTSNITFANNYIHDVKNGAVLQNTDGLTVSGNTYDYLGEDSMKFISVTNALIENNVGARHLYPAPGAHLDFIQFQGGDSSDVVIRGNLFLAGNVTSVQGIFLDDAHYTNILIEQNIIATSMIRGVSVSSGTNVVSRYNTLINIEGGSKATKSMVDGSSYGNIEGTYANDSTLGDGNNLVIQQSSSTTGFHYDDFFANADGGAWLTIADLAPVAGSLVEQYGAYDRLMELLTGVETGGGSTDVGAGTGGTDDTGGTDTPTTDDPEDPVVVDPTPTDPTPTDPTEEPVVEEVDFDTVDGAAFSMTGDLKIGSLSDAVEVAPDAKLALGEGTIALSFQADTIGGIQGLLARDASYYAGGGNHLSVYLEGSTLKVRFQDGANDHIVTFGGVTAGTEYDLQICFDGTKVEVFMDGASIGSASFGMDWTENVEYMQIGALGWGSSSGQSGYAYAFNGTISDVVIAEGAMDPTAMTAFIAGEEPVVEDDPRGNGNGNGNGNGGNRPADPRNNLDMIIFNADAELSAEAVDDAELLDSLIRSIESEIDVDASLARANPLDTPVTTTYDIYDADGLFS